MRPLSAYLSLTALANNLALFKSLAPNSQQCAVVKANAYGHRIELLLPTLEASVDLLAVAAIEEALEIRTLGAQKPVLLLEGVFEAPEYFLAANNNFHVVVANYQQLEWLFNSVLETPLTIYLKVDTGMHRLGFPPLDIANIYKELLNHHNVKEVILMTHFACADQKSSPLMAQQMAIMQELATIDAPQCLANSAAILAYPSTHQQIIRFGISLYGVSPLPDKTAKESGLKPLLTVKSKLIHTTILGQGESVSYGATFVAKAKMPLGVIACGYADGYPRELSSEAYVLIGAHKAPIVGRPTMDMMMIDLSEVPESLWNEDVTLFGDDLPIEMVAKWGNTIPYTILTHLGRRAYFHLQ